MEEALQWRLAAGGQAWSEFELDVEEIVESPFARPDPVGPSTTVGGWGGASTVAGPMSPSQPAVGVAVPPSSAAAAAAAVFGGRPSHRQSVSSRSQSEFAEVLGPVGPPEESCGSAAAAHSGALLLSVNNVERYLSVAIPASLWRSRPLAGSADDADDQTEGEGPEGESAECDLQGLKGFSAISFLRRRFQTDPEGVRLSLPCIATVAQHAPSFHLLIHLPSLVTWPLILCAHFSMKLSRKQALETPVAAFLSGNPQLGGLFDQFAFAWDACVTAGLGKRYECQELTPTTALMNIHRSVPLIFSCLGKHPEGVSLLALFESLSALQDEFANSLCENGATAIARQVQQEESAGQQGGMPQSSRRARVGGAAKRQQTEAEGLNSREDAAARRFALPQGLLEGASPLRLVDVQNPNVYAVAVPQGVNGMLHRMENCVRECVVGGLGALPPQPQHAAGGGVRWGGEAAAVLRGGLSSDLWILPDREKGLHWARLEGQLRSLFGGARRLQRPQALLEEEGGTFRFSGEFSQSKYFLKTFAETIPQALLTREIAAVLPGEKHQQALLPMPGAPDLSKELDFSSLLVSNLSRIPPASIRAQGQGVQGVREAGEQALAEFLETEQGAAICRMVPIPPLFHTIQKQLKLKHLAGFHETLEQRHAEKELQTLLEDAEWNSRAAATTAWSSEKVTRLERQIDQVTPQARLKLAANLRRFFVRFMMSAEPPDPHKLLEGFVNSDSLEVLQSCVEDKVGTSLPPSDPGFASSASSSAARKGAQSGADELGSIGRLLQEVGKFEIRAMPWIVHQLSKQISGARGKGVARPPAGQPQPMPGEPLDRAEEEGGGGEGEVDEGDLEDENENEGGGEEEQEEEGEGEQGEEEEEEDEEPWAAWQSVYKFVCQVGRLNILKWARLEGSKLPSTHVSEGAGGGKQGRETSVLPPRPLRRTVPFPWDSEYAETALRMGHFWVVRWMVSESAQPLPMSAGLYGIAARAGRVD
uniref:Uncharacterized protein n=1 Tax=Chromera velia CCMP2878 TaxID=1169474 RepID=A0A0G4G7X4_9ALVE|eukprot:Cvel_4325.t1-p1 / transcript=Cvel_4325.t1 / gene=Cvel_4325 / organism=Chromera_velia_CCMP2878 / gene_product=hypothetical protein / transcript_product=hypothetical protein / location=Cvel_scaffold187:89587-97493(-) / protein_length=989 / sequence_SO=supercontig / SO=protein_coding / is_pseudo=false